MAHRVIVKNLDFHGVTTKVLVEAFDQVGIHGVSVEDVHINRSGVGHPGKNCVAFVTLRSSAEGDRAIFSLNHRNLPGASTKPILVDKALPRISSLKPWDYARAASGPDLPDCSPNDIYKVKKDKKEKKEKKRVREDGYTLFEDSEPAMLRPAFRHEEASSPSVSWPDDAPWLRRVKLRNEHGPEKDQ